MNEVPRFPVRIEPLDIDREFDRPPFWRWFIAVPCAIAITLLIMAPVAELFLSWPAYLRLVAHERAMSIASTIR